MSEKYTHCVSCGIPKTTWAQQKSPRCRKCFTRDDYYMSCVDCGKPKTTRSQKNSPRCDACSKIQRREDDKFHSVCVDCGAEKSRNYYPRCKPCSKKKLWEDPEFQEKQRAYRTDPEYVRKQSESHIAIWADPEKREKQRRVQKERWSDPELRAQHSETLKASYAEKYSNPEEHAAICANLDELRDANWADLEHRDSHRRRMEEQWGDEDYRREMSAMVIEAWQDPEYRNKRRKTWIERYGADHGDYPTEFDYQLKEAIRDRDNRCCVLCGKSEEDNDRKLSVHHVFYSKDDCRPSGLVSLCDACHPKTNFNRPFWQQVFTKYMHRQPKQDWQHQAVIM